MFQGQCLRRLTLLTDGTSVPVGTNGGYAFQNRIRNEKNSLGEQASFQTLPETQARHTASLPVRRNQTPDGTAIGH